MLKRFFLFCSGADIDVLESCPKIETVKQVCVGISVLFTGIFASLAGGYAIYRVFYNGPDDSSPIYWGMIFGLLWGTMIFNLDRFIVSSMTKNGTFRQQLYMAIPRIVVAVFISLIIAKPLEVKIFENRIAGEIFDRKLDQQERDVQRILNITGKEGIDQSREAALAEVNDLEEQKQNGPTSAAYEAVVKKYNDARNKYNRVSGNNSARIANAQREINFINNSDKYKVFSYVGEEIEENKVVKITDAGQALLGTHEANIKTWRGQNSRAKTTRDDYKATKEKMEREYAEAINQKLVGEKEQLATLTDAQKKAEERLEQGKKESAEAADIAYSNTFITQVEALGFLTKYKWDKIDEETGEVIEEASNTMFWLNFAIIILFILIETSPVLVKLISPKGEYDDRLIINKKHNIAMLQTDSQTQIQLNNANNSHVLQVDLSSNQQLLQVITQAQVEIAEAMVQKWKEEELQKMNLAKHSLSPAQQVTTTI